MVALFKIFLSLCTISKVYQQSLFSIIYKVILGESINYLEYFEQLGFDSSKLNYFADSLPALTSLLFEPFITNQPYDLKEWNLETRIDKLLGENKWWFRSSGSSHFLVFIKSFNGIIKIIKLLEVNINWQNIFLKYTYNFTSETISSDLVKNILEEKKLAKNLIIHILKDKKEHVRIELPSASFENLEYLISDETKAKLDEQFIDIQKIKNDYLKNGLVPGEVFSLESIDPANNIITNFNVYLI